MDTLIASGKSQDEMRRLSRTRKEALLVEDSDIMQKVHSLYLEKLGFQVDLAETAYKALELAAQKDYRCILLDIGLPDFSGESVLCAIRYREQTSGQRVPIIINTAHGNEDLLQRCRENGADAALTKPITIEQVRDILTAVGQPAGASGSPVEAQRDSDAGE